MKFLVVLLVVVVVGWLLLRGRSREPARGAATAPKSLEVVACRHCGVHLPRAECVEDRTGVYCSQEHRIAGPSAR
jgi:uncharacterized protein